ncbi:MAG: metallophosphoesterase [Myxococcales bacterium]|nr:metallophosphoesterase [Myxococcales bacterium]
MRFPALALALFSASVLACSSSTDEPPKGPAGPRLTKLPPLAAPPQLTTTRRFVATKAPQGPKAGPGNPAIFSILDEYKKLGFGAVTPGPGEAYVTRAIDGTTPPPPGPGAKRLLRFVHMPDLQILDDESPTRLASFDATDTINAAARPQDGYVCRMTNAAVRTVNALHRAEALSFVLLGGDNADSAQTNEVEWVLDILSGKEEVKCDSGKEDDPIPGPDNDGKDPFFAEGLTIPWKWVTGNHDVNVQGNLKLDDGNRASVLSTVAGGGTRDYTQDGFIERGDFVVADAKRALLSRVELMTKVASHGDGHGLGDAEKASGRATYTFDAPDSPIRFLVIDTAAETGGAEGIIRQSEVDRVIKPALDKAQAEGKWVILASHHSVTSLTEDGGAFGTKQPDALTTDAWTKLVGGYPNVLFSMVGHSHEHRVRPIAPAGGHAFWEVMTSAIMDYPHQFRLVEIFDQDNGWIMLRGTAVDPVTDDDPVAAEGHTRGLIDFLSGWSPDGLGKPDDRNVELWIKKP